ncbi:threonine/serine exporter family protein [Brevibacterium litoralis]|uniref:threonine/serine exporter family protein n=1 Tax=Brevibacterium litoralis TaxID=3138935 RepID=UPI0032ED23FB
MHDEQDRDDAHSPHTDPEDQGYTGPTAGAALRTTANSRELAADALAEAGLYTDEHGEILESDDAETAEIPHVDDPSADHTDPDTGDVLTTVHRAPTRTPAPEAPSTPSPTVAGTDTDEVPGASLPGTAFACPAGGATDDGQDASAVPDTERTDTGRAEPEGPTEPDASTDPDAPADTDRRRRHGRSEKVSEYFRERSRPRRGHHHDTPSPDTAEQRSGAGWQVDAARAAAADPALAPDLAGETGERKRDKAEKLLKSGGRASKKISDYLVRSAKSRFSTRAAEEADTQPIPIVSVLRGTPYQEPIVAERRSEDEARMILDLAVDIGSIMLRAGAGTSDVEVSVIATCGALGLDTAEVDLTANSLVAHYQDPDGRLVTVMRVAREQSFHYAKLSAVHALVLDIVDHEIDYVTARERIDAIRRQKRPWTNWAVTIAWGILAGCFALLIGGSYPSALLGMLMAVLNDRVGAKLGGLGLPAFFSAAVMAAFTTLVAMTAAEFELIGSPQYLVASGIILLLPTQTLISVIEDALLGFPITAAGRTVQVVMSLAGIVTGIAVSLMIGQAFGMHEIEVLVESRGGSSLVWILSFVAAFGVAATGAVGMQTSKRIILPAALIGMAGFIAWTLLARLGLDNILVTFIAATFVGFLCRPVALYRGSPAVVMVIPGVFPLLQGLSVFAAVYQIVQPTEYVPLATGLGALFAAIIANAAIAVGVVLGDWLARPVSKRLGKRFGAHEIVVADEDARAEEDTPSTDGAEATEPAR